MSVLAAFELHPGLIGRRITFAGPNGSRISDELTSIAAFRDNEEVYVATANASPGDSFIRREFEFSNHWRLGWGVTVEIGEQMRGGEVKQASSDTGDAS